MSKKLLLALDIGNVCVKINHLNCVRRFGWNEIPDTLRNAAIAYECGQCSEHEFFFTLQNLLQNKFTLPEIKDAFNSILIEPVTGMVELVNSFAELNVQAVFFSDISPTHLQRTREIFPAACHIPEGIYSFECGALKPSLQMLEQFEARFGRPDLYTDDRNELITGAKEFGWHARQFTGVEELKAELIRLRD
jgi:hypothetical protein